MALIYKDRVRQKVTPSGTGFVNLGVPVDSYITFTQANISSNSFPYAIISDNLFEVGIGTFESAAASGTTYGRVYRNTVLANSSLDTSLVSFTGVLGDIIITNAADLSVLINSDPTTNTRRLVKWVDNEYQLLEAVENATALGASIGSSIVFYNYVSSHYQADPNLQFYPTGLPELYVNGAIYATVKSFKIKHPTKPGKKLIHGCLEGPEHGVYIRGNIKTRYKIKVIYPDYFTALSNDFSVFVTSDSVIPHKIKKDNIGFEISLIFPTIKPVMFSYLVIASRNDVSFKLEE